MKKITSQLLLWSLMLISSMAMAQSKTQQFQINNSSDDAEERGADALSNPGEMDLTSSDIELVRDGGDGNQYVGLRFTNITIPKGAIINNAYIQFTVDEDDDISGTVIWRMEDVDSSTTFTSDSFDISSRQLGNDSVVWSNIPVWNMVGANGSDQQTPDLSTLVQAAVNRSAWKSGNSINIIGYGSGQRVAEAYDGSAGSAAILVVEFTTPITATFQVMSGNDDSEEDAASGTIDMGSSDLEITTDGTSSQIVGARFQNVSIPAGSIIQDAYLQFTVDEITTTGRVDAYIAFEDADNATALGSFGKDLSNRGFTSNFVIWDSIPAWGTVGADGMDQRSPNLATALQEVIDRQGWASGNAVLAGLADPALLNIPGYSGNTGKRTAESYDGSSGSAPKLVVTYIPPAVYQAGNFPISTGASWKYDDSGNDLGATNWKDITYNDSNWDFGNAILGYGNGNASTPLSYGSDANNKHITYYLRNIFKVTDASQYDSLVFDVLRDDGVVVYVNGVEAFRSNMPAGTVNNSTLATSAVGGADETSYYQYKSGNLLQNGLNVIAVELHQSAASSSDLSFDMSVGFELPPLQPTTYPMSKNTAWHYLDDGSDLDNINWQDTNFNDDNWAHGPGLLGYGDPVSTEISFGPDPNNKIVTYYFRRDIMIDLATVGDSVEFGLLRDDGAIVYVNGVEVIRENLPSTGVTYTTTATNTISGSDETTYFTTPLPKTIFRNGKNQIAVQIHNRDVFSSDLAFDLYIKDVPVPNPPALGCSNGNQNHIACFTSIEPTSQTNNMVIPTTSHRWQLLVKQGDPYTKGSGSVGSNNDFTGYIGTNGSSEQGHLSINHETTPGGITMLDLHYDPTSHLWVVDTSEGVDFYNNDLVTTTRNCSGGITPWGTILTAEETQNGGDVNGDGYHDVGWLVEVDPITARVKEYGNNKQEKLWRAGNISHENAVVLNDSITLYTGEDGGSSAIFKFIADNKADLSSGTLYALKLNGAVVSGEPSMSTGSWVMVPNTTQADANNTRSLAISLGATNFNGVEDVEVGTIDGKIYFTSKGNGRIYRFTDNGMNVSNFETFVGGQSYILNTSGGVFSEPWGGGNDNLTFDDQGNLWVLQDGGRNYIWVVRPDHTQNAPKVELFMSTPAGSEPCGLTFSPDYRFGFVSIQHPSSSNTDQMDATGNMVAFDDDGTLVFSRSEWLGMQKPIAGFVADKRVVVEGNTVVFTDTSLNNPSSRSWTFTGGTPSVSTNPTETVTYNTPGFYAVELKVSNSVGADSASYVQYIEVVKNVGIDNPFEKSFNLYPNPTNGSLNIELSLEGGEKVSIQAYDLTGRLIGTLANETAQGGLQSWNFDLNDLTHTSSVMIIQIQVDEHSIQRKVQFIKR